jgi:arylsulfatase A-like enzyme
LYHAPAGRSGYPGSAMRHPGRALVAICAIGAAIAGPWFGYRTAYRAGRAPPLPFGRDGVIFIITDNVRADRTSLCGSANDTTPGLVALSQEPGAVHTCRAYAPGSWTLPSYFTGRTAVEHGAHEYDRKVEDAAGSAIPSRGLSGEFETLAEAFQSRGYQTVLLSGNPVVGRKLGLAQGFQHAEVAARFGEMDDEDVRPTLARVLREELAPEAGPLFLTVNLAEAHRPWDDVPADHPFLRSQSRLQFSNSGAYSRWRRYLEGEMSPAESARFLDDIDNAYTWGVQRADQNVQAVIAEVRSAGWCRESCRVVVTSDHGEHIGEHGLVDHGFYSWEANARVYVVASGVEATALPEPMSAMAVHWLVRDGRLPEAMPAVEQWAWPHARRAIHTHGKAFNSRSVARWTGWMKQLWSDGVYFQFDLQTDPEEAAGPFALEPDPDFAALRLILDENAFGGADDAEGDPDGDPDGDDLDVEAALKAAGYLE